jgi:hypothetical protein
MAAELEILNSLNEQQLMMLRLFKNPLPEGDFQQMRRLAVKLLARKLDEVTEAWEKDNQVTEETYDELSKGHFRSKAKRS